MTNDASNRIVQKLWSYCNVLRDAKKSSITVVNEEGETDRETLTYNRPDF